MSLLRCQYIAVEPDFWKGCDESEYYDQRGAFLWNRESQCGLVADPGHKYCPRHELLQATFGDPFQYKCQSCGAKETADRKAGEPCQACGKNMMVLIPAEYIERHLFALDILHGACVQVKKVFDVQMTRDEAKANLEARAILFNCSNAILREHGMPITYEEVEGARIIEREVSQ